MRVLLLVSRESLFALPGCCEEVDWAKTVDFVSCEELGEDFVHGARHAVRLRAFLGPVSVGEVEVAHERVVDEGLENDRHEAGAAHVEEAPKASGAAGRSGRVGFDVFEVFGGGTVAVDAPALASWIMELLEPWWLPPSLYLYLSILLSLWMGDLRFPSTEASRSIRISSNVGS